MPAVRHYWCPLFDETHDFLCYLEQRTEEILPGVIWRVWKRDVSLHGRSSSWVEYCFCSISHMCNFSKKFHGGLGGKILTLPMLWFHSYRSAKISNICVANLSEVLSASLQYHCAIGRRYPPWPFWINSVGFPPFFPIMQLTFPAFLVLLEGNAIFPLRSLACAWTKCVNYRFALVLSPPMTHTVCLGIGKYDSSCLGYDICLGLRIAVLKVEQRCNFPKVQSRMLCVDESCSHNSVQVSQQCLGWGLCLSRKATPHMKLWLSPVDEGMSLLVLVLLCSMFVIFFSSLFWTKLWQKEKHV